MNLNNKQTRLTTMLAASSNSDGWQKRQQEVAEMTARYGNARQFLDLFTPALQNFAAREPERAYMGFAPSLGAVAAGYGEETLTVFLCLEVEDLNLFAGVKGKMPVSRQQELARLIATEYPFLKASEVLLFFHRLKCGRYGRFYGSVDALFITSALTNFMAERRTDILRIEERQRKLAEASRPESRGITYEEYLRRKQERKLHESSDETKGQLRT